MLSYNFFHSILSFAKWDISINVCRFFDFEIYQQSHDCKIGNFTFYEGYYSAYLEQNFYLVHSFIFCSRGNFYIMTLFIVAP